MTTPLAQAPQLVVPFVTVAGFKAHPTYLDLADLRSGDTTQADQDAELLNILLIASADVERFCRQPIQAHIRTDVKRLHVDRYGRLYLNPDHNPARLLQSYSYGTTIGQSTSIGTPVHLIEPDGKQIIVELAGSSYSWSGSLQFTSPATGQELYTTYTYVAGWANTVLASSATAGATNVQITNPTGVFAGDVLRIWTPGTEETVTVASSWTGQNTSPFTSATIPLVSALLNNHSTGDGITGFPEDIYLATVYYAADALQRWGAASARYPGSRSPSDLRVDGDMSEWEMKAERRLTNYRRVR